MQESGRPASLLAFGINLLGSFQNPEMKNPPKRRVHHPAQPGKTERLW
jgi:hypothetical protein